MQNMTGQKMFSGLPPFGQGQRIGLLGGSFNPAHEGHRLISEMAIRRLKLDWLWWLVTPGNPLKDTRTLPPLAERMARAADFAGHPLIRITGVEATLGTRYTADTVERLQARAPGARFIWLMGADNLIQFEAWERWRDIADAVPIAVYDRPGHHLKALAARAAHVLAPWRLAESDAPLLGRRDRTPQWVYLTGPVSHLSSTTLRHQNDTRGRQDDSEAQD